MQEEKKNRGGRPPEDVRRLPGLKRAIALLQSDRISDHDPAINVLLAEQERIEREQGLNPDVFGDPAKNILAATGEVSPRGEAT